METKRSEVVRSATNKVYNSPSPGDITVVASTLVTSNESVIPREIFEEVVACGFNVSNIDLSNNVYPATLANCNGLPMRLMITHSWIKRPSDFDLSQQSLHDWMNIFVNGYENNSALGGWTLEDEPSYSILSKNDSEFDLLNRYDYIYGIDDRKHPIWVNLAGGGSRLENKSFVEYIQKFQNNFKPMFFSYDLYPISQANYLLYKDTSVANGSIKVSATAFYNDLMAASQIAKEAARPFWAYCMSMEYYNGPARIYRPRPLESHLRFEAFSALAFGAQGIVYWTYRQRKNATSDNELYLSALLTREGKRTAAWYFARKINNEIKKYKGVFLNSVLVGSVLLPGTTAGLAGNLIGPVKSVTGYSNLTGLLITRLYTNGRNYIVFVSRDVVRYQLIVIDFSLTASGQGISELTPRISGGEAAGTIPASDYVGYTRTLLPGGYLIFEWLGQSSNS